MKRLILVDADSLCFTSDKDDLETAIKKVDWKIDKIKTIFSDVINKQYDDIIFYLTMGKTFRNELLKTYKENRPDKNPIVYKLKDYLIKSYNAVYEEGFEADDLIADKYREDPLNHFICSCDKDLLYNLEGKHLNLYDYRFVFTTKEQATNNFYYQMIKGDRIDNIPDLLKGFGEVKLKRISEMTNLDYEYISKYVCKLNNIDYNERYRLLYMGKSKDFNINGDVEDNKLLEDLLTKKKKIQKTIHKFDIYKNAPGKHKGKTWEEVKLLDIGYINWMIENTKDIKLQSILIDLIKN